MEVVRWGRTEGPSYERGRDRKVLLIYWGGGQLS